MVPSLRTADLVLLHGGTPAQIHAGEIIAVPVPLADQLRYRLPAEVVHRVVRMSHADGTFVLPARGDTNPAPDPFATPAADVIGHYESVIPGARYPVVFLRNRERPIFLGAALAIVALYLLLGFPDSRRPEEPTPLVFTTRLVEAGRLPARPAADLARRGAPEVPALRRVAPGSSTPSRRATTGA